MLLYKKPSAIIVYNSTSTGEDKWIKTLSYKLSADKYLSQDATCSPNNTETNYAMAVGDVYYSDGDMSHQSESLISGKTPIGIVGYIGNNYWTEKGTKSSSVGGHALVMALKTIGSTGTTDHGTGYPWKTSNTDDGRTKVNTSALIVGSSNQSYGSGYKESVALNNSAHPAAQAALAYTTLKTPATSTGWFLPSAGQCYAIMNAIGGYPSSGWNIYDFVSNMATVTSKVNTALSKVGANNYTEFFQAVNTSEWTSTEFSRHERDRRRFGSRRWEGSRFWSLLRHQRLRRQQGGQRFSPAVSRFLAIPRMSVTVQTYISHRVTKAQS